MSSGGNYYKGKRIINLSVKARPGKEPDGKKFIFVVANFGNIFLHNRDENFEMKKYEMQPGDSPTFKSLATSLLKSEFIEGERTIFNLGAKNDIGMFIDASDSYTLTEALSDVTLVITLILNGSNFIVRHVRSSTSTE